MKLTWAEYVWDGWGPHRPAWAGVRAQWAGAGVGVLIVGCLVKIRIGDVLSTWALGASRSWAWVAVRRGIRILIWIWTSTCVDVGALINVWAWIWPGAGTGETVLICVSVLIKIWVRSLIIIWWCLIVIGVLTLVTIWGRVTVWVALRTRVVVGSWIIVWARLLTGSALVWPLRIWLCRSRTGSWVGVWSLTSVSWQILRRRDGRSCCCLRCWWWRWVVRGGGRCWGARGTRACALSRAWGGWRGGHHRRLRRLRWAGYWGLRGRSCNANTSV